MLKGIAIASLFVAVVSATGPAPVAADYRFSPPFTSSMCTPETQAGQLARAMDPNCLIQVRNVKETGLVFGFTPACNMSGHGFNFAPFQVDTLSYVFADGNPPPPGPPMSSMPPHTSTMMAGGSDMATSAG